MKRLPWRNMLLAGACFIFACKEPTKNDPAPATSVTTDSPVDLSTVSVRLNNWLAQKRGARPATVNVSYDHYFEAPAHYKGFPFKPLLDSIIKATHFDTAHAILVFECSDGYRPQMDLSKVYGSVQGYIVILDSAFKAAKGINDSLYQKFSPAYLVWDKVPRDDQSFPWPYGLSGLTLIHFDQAYASIYPYHDPSSATGFRLFRNNCMKCHSLNKIGGTLAPEFNLPKNITDYWQPADIIAFARAPYKYRYSSKMPPVTNLSDSDFNQIIRYLKYLGANSSEHPNAP